MQAYEFDPSRDYQQAADHPAVAATSRSNQTLVAVAMILASALYLSGVFTAGLMLGNRTAWLLALATMGICYITALVQLAAPNARTVALALTAWSILLGFIAGLVLLVW